MSTSCQLAFPILHCDKVPVRPDPASPVQYFPYFDGGYLAVAASLNSGNVLTNYVSMIQKWNSALGIQRCAVIYMFEINQLLVINWWNQRGEL